MSILFSRACSYNTRTLLPSLHPPMVALTFSSGQLTTPTPLVDSNQKKERVLVIMGATGTGKSRLSIDMASIFPSEIVNADKIQVYRGLDITTNKIPLPDRRGIPHHLLGDLDPASGELCPDGFRSLAASAVSDITSRRRLPVVAGGSNSFIHALVSDRFDRFNRTGFRYRCSFLWVDVAGAVLREYLDRRVEEMVGMGMVEELEAYFAEGERVQCNAGLEKAIGVAEFRGYFGKGMRYEEVVRKIKERTRRLAERQVGKIVRLREGGGWALQRVDATEAVRAKLRGDEVEAEVAWQRDVVGPSVDAVKRFLDDEARLLLPLS